MGDLSPHFSRAEFRCHGFGHAGHPDHDTPVSERLVDVLEQLRRLSGNQPLHIVSGHRCPWWNRHVGGARASKHMTGEAADLPAGYATVTRAAAAGAKGIGRKGSWAVHVDVRARAARWVY